VNVLNLSNKMIVFLDLLKVNMPFKEVGQCYGKKELSILTIHCFFLNGSLLGTMYHGYQGSIVFLSIGYIQTFRNPLI
jgi:hypothetical protein